MLLHIIDHVGKRRAGEKDFVDAFSLHFARVVMRDRSATTAENRDIVRALPFQLPNDVSKKFDVTAVVTGNANGGDVLLNRRPNDIADVAMEAEIDNLDAVSNELEIDRVDRAVVSVTNRDGG